MATIQERLEKMRLDNLGQPETAADSGQSDIGRRLDSMRKDLSAPRDPSKLYRSTWIGSGDYLKTTDAISRTARESDPLMSLALQKAREEHGTGKNAETVSGKGIAAPGSPGGGGRGYTTVADLDHSKATAGDYMAAIARDQQRAYSDMVTPDNSPMGRQREAANKAMRIANAFMPLENGAPVDDYLRLYDAAAEEEDKLHDMGGRSARELPQTVGEAFGAGIVSSARGLANMAGYIAQRGSEAQMEENAEMWRRAGREDYARDMETTRDALYPNGYESVADDVFDSAQKAAKFLMERPGQAEAENTAEMWRRAGREDYAADAENVAKALEQAPKNTWSDLAKDYLQRTDEHIEGQGKIGKAIALTSQGVGGMIPSILSNIIVPGSGLPVMFFQAAGNATEEALQKGASKDSALVYGAAVGGVEVLTEKMFGGIPGLGIGALDEGIENAIRRTVGNETAQRALLFFMDALGEGVEEFTSEFGDWLLDKWLVGSDERTFAEVHKDAWYSFLIGALTSVAMQAPAELVKTSAGRRQLARQIADQVGEQITEESGTDARLTDPLADMRTALAEENAPTETGGVSTALEQNSAGAETAEAGRGAEREILSDNAGMVQSFAEGERDAGRMNKAGAKAMMEFYDEAQAPVLYIRGMAAAYNAGANGAAIETVRAPGISDIQREAAYLAGQSARTSQTAKENKNAPAAQKSTAEASSREGTSEAGARSTSTVTGGQAYAEGNDVSDGSGQRNDGIRAREQAGRLEGSTGKEAAGEVRTAAQRHALVRDLRLRPADPVNDFQIPNAVNTGETYVLPEDQTDAPLRKIREDNRRSGVETVFILGSIPFRKTNGAIKKARGTYVPATNTVYVQADNLSATPEQIAEHELWHARWQNLPAQDRLLEERIRERYSPEEFEKVLDRYISALAGVIDLHEGMTDAEYEAALGRIKNELFADAVSGLNGFGAGATQFTETAQQFRDEFWGTNSQTAEATESTTGPPAGDAMFSSETEDDADERAKSFSYDALTKKDPVRVVKIQSKSIPTRGKRINANALAVEARAKAPVIVYQAENGDAREQRYVFIPDLGANVLFNTKGVLHGAVGNITNASARVTAEVTPDLAEILQNSIKVNERGPRAKPKKGDGEYSHVLIGAAENEKGDIYIVRSQIGHFADNKTALESMEIYDVLKGAKAKKMESGVMRTHGTAAPQLLANTTDSYYTVADLLEIVKENYPNILPKDVLAHFGIDASVQDDGIVFSVDDEADTDELRQELRARGNVETRRNLADTDRAAFRENEERRRQLRKDIREQSSRPKEIAAVEKELERLQDKQYQHDLLDKGGAKALAENERQIKQLTQRLERLRGEEQKRKKPERTKKTEKKSKSAPTISVRQLQNDLLRYFDIPEGQRAELGKFVETFANKVFRDGKITQDDVDALMDRLYSAGVVTVPATEYQRAGRDAVKDGRVYVPEQVKAEFGDDWNRFRVRAMAAGVYMVNDAGARGADQWNAELSDLFPGIFDARDTDLREILEKIVQLAEEGKDQKMSLADYSAMIAGQEYVTEDQIQDEMERHIDYALRTYADKAGLEVFLKDRTDRMVQQERAVAWERRQQERQRQKADRELRELQQKTLKQVQWLEKNRNQAPAVLRPKIDEVLSDLNFYSVHAVNEMRWSSKYKMTFGEIADLIERKTNENSKEHDVSFIPTKELTEIWKRVKLNNSGVRNIGEMDIGDLRQLYNAAAQLRQEVYDRNNLVNDEFNRTVAGVAADSIDELKATAKAQKKGKLAQKADEKWQSYNDAQLTPMNRFEQMAGWRKDSAWYSLAKMLEKGERDQRRFIYNANAMLADFMKQNKKWVQRADGQGKDGIWYEVQFSPVAEWGEMDQPIFGDPVTVWMTPAMKVQMYLESKSEDNLRHMAGGRTFANKELYSRGKRAEAYKQGARTFLMTPEAVKKIVSDLTVEEKALADILERFYNEFSKGEINRVSNALYGYDKAMGRYYAPIYTDSNYNRSEPGVFDVTAEGVGNLKTRKESWTPSLNISAIDAFEKSVDRTAKFVGLAIPVRNVNAVLNWKSKGESVKKVIDDTQGAGTVSWVEDLMTELQGNKDLKHPKADVIMDKALSKYVQSVFGANWAIVAKQFASFPLATAYLGWGNMPKWLPGAAQVDRELVRKYTGELGYRNMGYATPETALMKDNPGLIQSNRVLNFVFGGGAINWMDDFTVRTLWTWAENKVRNETQLRPGTQTQIDAGEDAFYKAVASEFEEAVSRSQPMYDVMHRSQVMRESSGVSRAFTMFKTVPQQEYNMLREAFGEMSAARESGDTAQKREAAAKAGKAVLGIMVGNLMIGTITFLNALWKNKAKKYRDDDGELIPESVMEQFIGQYLRDSAGVFIGGDVAADVIGAILGEHWYSLDAPGLTQISEILEGVVNAGKTAVRLVQDSSTVAANGGDWAKYMREHGYMYVKAVEDAVRVLATYKSGLPINNVRAYLLGALSWASPAINVAYEDAVKHADRDGLKGLTGDALEMRLGHILDARLEDPSEDLTKELAKLYADGYTNAVPTDTPSSVTIDGESHSLGAVQQQIYSNTWRDAVGDSLDELIRSDAYKAAGEKTKTAMIKKIYDYAANEAKGAVFRQFDAGEENKNAIAAMQAGATLSEWAALSVEYAAIDADKDKSTAERGAMKREAILEMDLTDQEKLDLYAAMAPAERRTEKLQAIKNSGLSTARTFAIYDKYDEIDNSVMAASEKAATFSRWIDGQKFTERQAEVIREQLTFSVMSTATAGTYDNFTAVGLSPDKSYQLFETLRKLKPEEGRENVTDGQKLHAIAEAKLTDMEKISAMGAIMGTELVNEYGNPTGYAKMLQLVEGGTTIGDYLKLRDAGQVDGYIKLTNATGGMSYGITPDIYVSWRAALPSFDADGNKSYSQAEVRAGLDAMRVGGSNPLLGGELTTTQKAVLWQMANSSWKPYKNPYDTGIGKEIYDTMQMLKEVDALNALSSGTGNPLLGGELSGGENALLGLALEAARDSLR